MESIREYFEEVETTKEYDGYYYQVGDIVSIVVLGSLCGLKNLNQLHQWAKNEGKREFLRKEFKIERIPCYYWFLCLLKMVKPDSLSRCLMRWAEEQLPEDRKGVTVSLDGKTVRSTGKMDSYESPLHVVSAQLCELGITLGSKSVEGKSNEIPAVQELLRELEISGCMVVADALHCQKKTAKAVVDGKGDYLLSVKGNQKALETDISDYVQDPDLRKNMDTTVQREKNRGRIEKRTAFVTDDVGWIPDRQAWPGLCCIGAMKASGRIFSLN